jgi:glycine/serine hydroxymethyltransferase
MKFIARVFAEAIENREDETKLKELREEVRQLCRKFPVYKD